MKLLIIEDDPQLRRVLEISFEREGYLVETQPDGEAGFNAAVANEYDGIIIDRHMPKMEGTEVCQKLRAEGVTTPIMMLTAADDPEDRVEGLDLGADDYLGKPFGKDELYARVRALVRRKSKTLMAKVTVGDLVLDPNTRSAEKAGDKIELMPKEYSLLEYMMRNEGAALTREQILEAVWAVETDHSSNRLDVYIKKLREKLDQPYSSNLIKTVRGTGYMISID